MLWTTAEAGVGFVAVWGRFGPAGDFVLLIVPGRCFCGGSFCFVSWCLEFLCCWRLVCVLVEFGWLGGRLYGGWLPIRLTICFHGIST